MLGCRNQWELPAYFERNKPRASKKIAGKNLSYTTGRVEKLLTGCWYVWNRLDHYQRIGTSQMLFRCALMTLTGAWPRGLWITPFSFMNAAIKFERLEVMEERELASERASASLSMKKCAEEMWRSSWLCFRWMDSSISQSKLEEWRPASSTTSLRKTEPESGRPCDD